MADTRALHPLCTIKETGAILRVDRSTIYRRLRNRELTLVKVGSRSFITRESIDAFLEANTEPAELKRAR